ncbi:MAG: translocation/assembly module TamB domain-containing protein [Deltaproteobacteria bacterium]
MRRAFTYFIIALVLAALAACIALPVWIFGTTAGAKKLLDAVSGCTPIRISAGTIEGKLAGTLRLENITIAWPQGTARIRRLEMSAQPLDLLLGQVGIRHLSLKDLSVQDNTPEKPPTLVWPRATGLVAFFSGQVGRCEISNLAYRHLDKQPVEISRINASVAWINSQLSAGNLHIAADRGVVEGSILAGFGRPRLEMDLAATPSRPLAGMDAFRLHGKFGPGKHAGELAGSLLLSGDLERRPQWQMALETGMTPAGFPLNQVRLHRPQQKGLITAEGRLTLTGPLPFLNLRVQAIGMDLSRKLGVPMILSGTLTFAGTSEQYGGRLALAHQGPTWQAIRLAGDYSGNAERLTLPAVRGSMLHGTLSGNLTFDWQNGLTARGAISGRNLDPAGIDPAWAGVIHFDLSGRVSVSEHQPPDGEIVCTLLQSRLHGQQLTGNLRAAFADDDIRIVRLALQGKDFEITAAGSVRNKVDFTARVSDLSRLIPQTKGSLAAHGWARWRDGRPSGALSAKARDWNAGGFTVQSAELTAAMEDREKSPLSLNATLHTLRYHGVAADTLMLAARGTLSAHTLTAAVRRGREEMHLALTGAYHRENWQGKITRLDGADSVGSWRLVQPAALSVTSGSLTLEPMAFTGRGSETFGLSAKLAGKPLTGSLAFNWHDLNLARVNFWLDQKLFTGVSSGNIHLNLLPDNRIALDGKFSLSGTLQAEGQSVSIRQSEINLKADERGIRAGLDIELTQGGNLHGTFASSSPARLALPDEGDLNLRWHHFDLMPFSAWLPGRAKLEGQMAGEARGKLLPDHRFSLTGRTTLARSKIHWQGQKGDVSVNLRDASLDWVWRDETFSSSLTLTMAEYGKMQGTFLLPVAARLPVAVDRRGSLQGSLTGTFREKGALGVLFPGLVQESHGDLDLDLKLSGTWEEPQAFGTVRLSNAGGYLPTAGISIKDARIAARFDKNTIHVDSFSAASGAGAIEGSALIRMKGMKVESYEGRLNGERFQTIYFPELQVQSSPRLTFYGTPETLSVRGDVLLPVVQIIGSQTRGPVEASPDVIREGKAKPAARKLPINLDVQVKMILGDSVLFKASGIDAQLGGDIGLQFQDPSKITGRGEIRVVKGRFRTYGVNLDIIRGRLFYAGTPINQPSLDILAWRKVGDVRAGVVVSGKLQNPLIKLYSEPFMQDPDILAYIVLGRPLGSDSQQLGLLATAAGALLSANQSEDLLSRIKNRLGLGSVEISTDVVKQNGYMGYKRLNVTSAGTGGVNSTDSVSETMLVVGKYLTPELYISYGRSLFSGGNLFFLRYDLSKSWQVETQTGKESGVDIYYKLEFN